MILPIGDEPNPRNFTPWVTRLLIGINVLVYVLFTLPLGVTKADVDAPGLGDYIRFLEQVYPSEQVGYFLQASTMWDLAVFQWGFRATDPQTIDMFTSMFMHAGFMHLAGNMLFLWIYGDNVEHRLGRIGYLLFYLGSGVAATLTHAWLSDMPIAPLVGASGAISGVLGAYFVMFPRNYVKTLIGIPPILFNVILVPAWLMLGAYYLLYNNLLPLLAETSTSVAYLAHLGGFAVGVAVAVPLAFGGFLAGRTNRGASAEGGGRVAGAASEPLGLARQLMQEGRAGQARQVLMAGILRSRGAQRASLQLALGQLLAGTGRHTEAFQWLYRAMQHPSTQDDARRALQELGLDPRLASRIDL